MPRKPKLGLLVADLTVIATCFLAAFELRLLLSSFFPIEGAALEFEYHLWAVVLCCAIWVPLFTALRLDSFGPQWMLFEILWKVAQAVAILMALVLALSYLQKIYYSRILLVSLFPLLVIGLVATRLAARIVLYEIRERGIGTRRVVLVGNPLLAESILERFRLHPELNYQIMGLLTPADTVDDGTDGYTAAFSSSTADLPNMLESHSVQEMFFAMPLRGNTELLDLIARCQQRGIGVRLLPEFHEIYPFVDLVEIGGLPFLEIRESPLRGHFKGPFDFVLGLLVSVILSPVLLGLGACLFFVNRRSVILRQTRVGQFGRPFTMYKFVKPGSGPAVPPWKRRLGEFFDKYSLLELPQFFNVLKGEMSLVGPRPEKPERVCLYSDWHKKRLAVKPGITGYAQVHGLRGASSSDEKTRYDLEYIARASWLSDLLVLVRTVGVVFGRFRHRRVLPSDSAPLLSDRGERRSSA